MTDSHNNYRNPPAHARRGLIMASETDRVAAALNRITSAGFLDALSTNDRMAMADFVADFFCGENTDNSDSEGRARYRKLLQ